MIRKISSFVYQEVSNKLNCRSKINLEKLLIIFILKIYCSYVDLFFDEFFCGLYVLQLSFNLYAPEDWE